MTLNLPATLRHNQVVGWLSGLKTPEPGQDVLLDASALTDFDSSALAGLLELRRRTAAAGVKFQIQGLPERIQNLAQVYGISDLL